MISMPPAQRSMARAIGFAAFLLAATPGEAQTLPALTCNLESQHLTISAPGSWLGFEKGNSITLTFTDIDLGRQTARVAQNRSPMSSPTPASRYRRPASVFRNGSFLVSPPKRARQPAESRPNELSIPCLAGRSNPQVTIGRRSILLEE
jgi:hypothetical protein